MAAINAEEVVELQHGARKLKGAIKNAIRLCSALELEEEKRQLLSESRGALVALIPVEPDRITLTPETIYAVRVSVRLRHKELKGLQKKEKAIGVEENSDVAERIETCEALGRKLGIQLDLIDHGEEDESEQQEMAGV